jgi:hypothetical protein
MSSQPEHSLQTAGFWIFGFISVVLVVLKLTVTEYWSWWRVMLPLLTFLGHNALYILVGLLCFRWLQDDGEGSTDESTIAEKHSRYGYNIVALFFFFLFLDNLLRRVEGQSWDGFWPCSGRLEVVLIYFVLSLLAQFAFWSRIVRGLNQEHA